MSNAQATTQNTIGVRALGNYYSSRTGPMHGMSGIMLGSAPDPDTITALVSNGYDISTINTMVALGATDEQLLALPFPASADEIASATAALMGQLGGVSPAAGAPMSTAPLFQQQVASAVISTSFGSMDLSSTGTWQQIAQIFNQVGSGIQQLAASGDAQAQAYKSQFNSLLSQFNAAWSAAMTNTSPGIATLAGMGDLSTTATTGIIVIAGTAVALTVGLPITLTVGSILAGLYVIYQYLQTRNAGTAVAQTQANTQQTQATTQANVSAATQQTITALTNQATGLMAQAAAIQATNPTLAAQYIAQANALMAQASALAGKVLTVNAPGGSSAPINWSLWIQNNWPLLAAAGIAAMVLPGLIKKL